MKKVFKNIISQSNLWGAVLPLLILGTFSIINLFLNPIPFWYIYTILGFILIDMLGISAGYHRYASHRGFKVSGPIKIVMLWFGAMAAQGSPLFWTAIHRGYHHRYTDTDKDLHTPNHGFFHSYIGWMFKLDNIDYTATWTSVAHLLQDRFCLFLHNHYIKILWASNIIIALIDINLWLYFIILPAYITFHSFSLQTSLTHCKNIGYRNVNTNDNSVNLPWLWFILFGEAWHNNHHADPKNPNHSKRWWELDPTFWVIKLIRTK